MGYYLHEFLSFGAWFDLLLPIVTENLSVIDFLTTTIHLVGDLVEAWVVSPFNHDCSNLMLGFSTTNRDLQRCSTPPFFYLTLSCLILIREFSPLYDNNGAYFL